MPSSSGVPNERAACNAGASGSSVVEHQTTPHTLRMCSSSGNGGAGGTVRNAKKPQSSSGASPMKSRYQPSTSAVSSMARARAPP